MSGGEHVPEDLIPWVKENIGADLNEIIGQTEANLLVCTSPLIMQVKPGFIGKPCPGHDVKVFNSDSDGTPVNPGEIGEIVLKLPDPVAMLEYYRNSEATAKKIRNGYLWTGDMAALDDDGYLKFAGRNDDIIKVSAYRLNPIEIEDIINKHPAVDSAVVVGVEDPIRGTIIAAYVKLKAGYEPSKKTEEELRNFVKTRLAAYAYPRLIVFTDNIPATITGKVRRVELREELKKQFRDRLSDSGA